jgi:release factor glutamine methyltransferase
VRAGRGFVTDVTWPQLRAQTGRRLESDVEAAWLVEEVTGDRWPAGPVTEAARHRLAVLVERRLAGEPLQYVIGRWAFRSLDLMVDRRVLIPRPETEQVVEVALAELDRLTTHPPHPLHPPHPATDGVDRPPAPPAARPAGGRLVAVDLGTGSGAIALAVAAERPGVEVWATDVSPAALEVAGANLAGLGGPATRVRLAQGSWWTALPDHLRGRVDLAVSNPPYIAADEIAGLDAQVVDWEPKVALEAGPTGLEALRDILRGAAAWLRPGGVAVIEIAPHQAESAAAIARDAGFAAIEVRPDLAGRDRTLVARGSP